MIRCLEGVPVGRSNEFVVPLPWRDLMNQQQLLGLLVDISRRLSAMFFWQHYGRRFPRIEHCFPGRRRCVCYITVARQRNCTLLPGRSALCRTNVTGCLITATNTSINQLSYKSMVIDKEVVYDRFPRLSEERGGCMC